MLSCFCVGALIILNVPRKRFPMYCSFLLVSAPCHITSPSFLKGLGPNGFAIDVNPFPFDTKILLPITFTFVGYQPVGINPVLLLWPGLVTSNTARHLLSALAMYKFFSSPFNATPFEVEPLGEFG